MTVDKRVRQAETQEIVGRVRCYRVLCSDVNTSLGDFRVSYPLPPERLAGARPTNVFDASLSPRTIIFVYLDHISENIPGVVLMDARQPD